MIDIRLDDHHEEYLLKLRRAHKVGTSVAVVRRLISAEAERLGISNSNFPPAVQDPDGAPPSPVKLIG